MVDYITFSSLIGGHTPFHSHHGKDGFHILRSVIHLVAYLAVSQRAVLPHRLQGSRADAEQPANVVAVKPFPLSQVLMFPAEPFHLFSEILEPREHPLESRLLYDHYFHIPVNLSLTLIFTVKRNEAIMLSRPFRKRRKQKNGNGRQNGRHVSPADIPFHRPAVIPKVKTEKDTLISLKQR